MSTRTDIRNAVKTISEAVSGITTVYIGRRRTIPASALPALCIYIEEEEKELNSMATPRTFVRQMAITSELHATAASAQAAEELLDTLTAARETAILADETLTGLVESIFPASDEYNIDEEGSRPAAVAICRDVVIYVE